jgi:hypothetical protein
MKLILDIHNPGRKYDFNAYSVFEFDDGSVSPDTRKIHTDNLNEFLASLKAIMEKENVQ